jgi:hypothetical protein
LGSLSFAITRTWTPTPARVQNGIAAGQSPFWSDVVSQLQTIALTLSAIDAFAMTSHAECVARLEKTGSDLLRSDSR